VRTLRLAPGPRDRLPRTTRTLWATSAAFLVVGLVLLLALTSGRVDRAERVADTGFLRQASARCVRAEEEDIGPNRKRVTGAAEADRIEALAAGWDAMVTDLRALPVDAADEAKVDRWLGAWERWTSLGHAYADALRAGDAAGAERIVDRSQAPKRAINHFAYVNGISDCVFP
jgi:hypothetical protein